jgi:hypothetical protein
LNFASGVCTGLTYTYRSAIISRLVELQHANPDGVMAFAFLYFNYKEQSEQTTTNMISSILQQLLQKLPRIPQDLLDIYESNIRKNTRPALQEILQLLEYVISEIPRTYLVIDALDECTDINGTRSQLIRQMLKLPADLKILCTSRDLPDIEQLFGEEDELRIQAQSTDVEKFLIERIDKSSRLKKHVLADPSLLKEITTTIIARVEGMLVFSY